MKQWLRGTNAAVLSVAVIGIFIALTMLVGSFKGFEWDLTKNKNFTLSEQTKSALSELKQDIRIVALTNAGVGLNHEVMDMLKEYKKRSSHITVEEYDMTKEPSIAKQYEVDANGTIVLESGSNKKVVHFYEMFMADNTTGGYQFTGEEKFTNALMGLTSTEKHTVYFLTGHEETPLEQMSALRASLEGENYVVKELNLLREGAIPADAEMIFAVGPSKDISDKETELLRTYMNGKGKLYLSLGFNKDMASSWKNIDGIMADYGIKDQHAIAVESKQNALFDPLTIIPNYGSHPITDQLAKYDLITLLSLAISMNHDEANEKWTATPILQTSDHAYGETDIALLGQSKTTQDDKDMKGPLNLGYVIESKEGKPKAIFLGSSTILMDGEINKQGNRDFALNAVSWLQEKNDGVTIRPRQGANYQMAAMTPGGAQSIFWGTIVIIPLLFLLTGGWIWWRRRLG
ncbi:GldG family protein [Paenibacillus sp. N1-5-1-14]|uniref:GldG family protein n=1 Tax=Paenibacillus radicibacter TaxID=2972488 RepID=UPI00215910B9|nr:GldG family protein [Paenibacillus radicibacter]MCR8644967.1 GldG family protein [Paenibacillus radicibacter]